MRDIGPLFPSEIWGKSKILWEGLGEIRGMWLLGRRITMQWYCSSVAAGRLAGEKHVAAGLSAKMPTDLGA